MDRVESEWSSHEQNLTEDYNRTKITEKIGHNRQKVAEKSPAQKRQFSANLDSLHAQKAASQRWMNRQSIRLTSQAKEIALERAKIGDLLGQELSRALSRSTI